LCHRIIEHFPPHDTYLEPFGGAASVLLNKVPSPVEVYNDLDERITRLFRVLRDTVPNLFAGSVLLPTARSSSTALKKTWRTRSNWHGGTSFDGGCRWAVVATRSVSRSTGSGEVWPTWFPDTFPRLTSNYRLL
jgi:hypothetical protein